MRTSLVAVLLVFATWLPVSAQTLRVEVTDGLFRTSMTPAAMPYEATGPFWEAIPASPPKIAPTATPLAAQFRIRSWIEGEGVRVVVSAVTRRDTAALRRFPDSEEQIASLALQPGESVEIAAADKYNARRIRVNAVVP